VGAGSGCRRKAITACARSGESLCARRSRSASSISFAAIDDRHSLRARRAATDGITDRTKGSRPKLDR